MKRRYLASIFGALALFARSRHRDGHRCSPRGAVGRPERRQRATGDLRLRSDANRSEQHEHLRPRAQRRRRRAGDPVQHGVVECNLVQLQLDDAGRESGSGRGWHPDVDPGRRERAARRRALVRESERGEQHEPSGSRASPGSNGAVTQSNYTGSTAGSTNTNTTGQTSNQDQSGRCPAAAPRRRRRPRRPDLRGSAAVPQRRRRPRRPDLRRVLRVPRRRRRPLASSPPTSRPRTSSSREPHPRPRRSTRPTRTSRSACSAPGRTGQSTSRTR